MSLFSRPDTSCASPVLLGGFFIIVDLSGRWRGFTIGAWPLSAVEIRRGCRLAGQSHVEVWLSEGVVTVEKVALEAEVRLGRSLAVIRPRSVPGEGHPSSTQGSAGSAGKTLS